MAKTPEEKITSILDKVEDTERLSELFEFVKKYTLARLENEAQSLENQSAIRKEKMQLIQNGK